MDTRTRTARSVSGLLAVATLLPLVAHALLQRAAVPLGCPNRFVYLYSPVIPLRLRALPAALLLATLLAGGLWLIARERRAVGWLFVAVASGGLGLWSYIAPPSHFNQHFFNMHSPSHDGAFVEEALTIEETRDYLRDFPHRVRTTPEAMRGTRVISNPPGATLIALAAHRFVSQVPALKTWITHPLVENPMLRDLPQLHPATAAGIVYFWLLTGMWLISGVFWFLTARLFVAEPSALAYAACCLVAPGTLLFLPGKDPAQLLTVSLPLYLWLLAWHRRKAWAAALAGIAGTTAVLMSLVHVWLGSIILVATLGSAWQARDLRRTAFRCLLPATAGAVVAAATLYGLTGLDLLTTIRSVADAQATVTRGPDAMPLAWQLLGIPLFLLFAGPAWWLATLATATPTLGSLRTSDHAAHFGRWLLIATGLVMLATVGFTNVETPRLWIPFVPFMLLGGWLQFHDLRQTTRPAAILLSALVFCQVAVSSLQWSLMDMREAETRLTDEAYFDRPAPEE
jgi:hypothetical protein